MKRKHIWKAGFPPEASALVEDRLYLLKVTDITVKVTAEQVTVAYAGSSPVLGGLPNEGAGKIRTEKSGQPSSKNQTFKGTGRKGVKKWRLVTEGNWITIIWFWKEKGISGELSGKYASEKSDSGVSGVPDDQG